MRGHEFASCQRDGGGVSAQRPVGSQVKGHEHSEGKIKVICGLSWNLQGWLEADISPEIDPVSLGSAPSLASA